jgi:hypothetical protein
MEAVHFTHYMIMRSCNNNTFPHITELLTIGSNEHIKIRIVISLQCAEILV